MWVVIDKVFIGMGRWDKTRRPFSFHKPRNRSKNLLNLLPPKYKYFKER
jgi:hypothetical protein